LRPLLRTGLSPPAHGTAHPMNSEPCTQTVYPRREPEL
jgi:hypothetical protein